MWPLSVSAGGPKMSLNSRAAVGAAVGAITLASAHLMGFLSLWEDGGKPQAKVYADPLAGGIPTACMGITKRTSPYPVIVGDVWSAEKCVEVGGEVVKKEQMRLSDCITRPVPQEVFDALTSHAHNLGVSATCSSRAVALINAGDLAKGCDAIAHAPNGSPAWSFVSTNKMLPNGKRELKFVQGLYKRRLAERALCLSGVK